MINTIFGLRANIYEKGKAMVLTIKNFVSKKEARFYFGCGRKKMKNNVF